MSVISTKNYPTPHNKGNGGGGGLTLITGGVTNGDLPADLHVTSITATKGDIGILNGTSLSYNDGQFVYIGGDNGKIWKLRGSELYYDSGFIGTLNVNEIEHAGKITTDDLDATNAWIKTLNSENITTEFLTVTKQAHFFELIIDKVRSVGGQIILTPASCVVDYVKTDEYNQYYDIFWRAEEEGTHRTVSNDWKVGDQAFCQSFNNAHEGSNLNISNKYYWRLVNSILADRYMNFNTGEELALNEATQATVNKVDITEPRVSFMWNNQEQVCNTGWTTRAQVIEGIHTGVAWEGSDTPVTQGTMSTTGTVFGIQLQPEAGSDLSKTAAEKFMLNCSPARLNIGIYYTDDTYEYFPAPSNATDYYEFILKQAYDDEREIYYSTNTSIIEAVVITNADEVEWHLVHGIRISNVSGEYAVSLVDGASTPTEGDSLVQLGYQLDDDRDRQSAIIISAYKSPDPNVTAPSYAQYMGINEFNLESHRGSYIDARGAKFVGDITMCTINGSSIGDSLNNIETKSKKLIPSSSIIQLFEGDNNNITAVPSTLDITILSPNQNGGTDQLTTVPEGYEVKLIYNRLVGQNTTSTYNAGDSLSNIQIITGSTIGEITKLGLYLYKLTYIPESGSYSRAIVDSRDLTYLRGSTGDAVDGGHTEFRYRNTTQYLYDSDKPAAGTDGTTNGWARMVSSPNVANNEFTWMTQCYVTAAGEYGTWTTPIRITGGNGKDGEDGTDIEFIYCLNDGFNHTNTPYPPSAPTVADDPTIAQDDWPNIDGHTPSKTVNGVTWYDNPQGVASNMKFEYMAQRFKLPGTSSWTPYTTPVVWSNWGVKGQDGDGFEYIFLLSQENDPSLINNPTPNDWNNMSSDYQNMNEYARYLESHVPSGLLHWWTDDPESISSTWPYVYVAKRTKKANGSGQSAIISGVAADQMVWTQFTNPTLWARYASQGSTGAHYEFRYCNYKPHTGQDLPTKPTTGSQGIGYYGNDGATYGGYWGYSVAEPDVEHEEFTYMSQCLYTPVDGGSDYYGEWTTPVRITGGNGKAGEDGADIEFIYCQKGPNTWANPAAPTTADDPTVAQDDWPNVDGHTPSKTINGTTWYDNPQGVNATNHKYEYMAQRIKPRGSNTWGAYTTPVIWSAYGEKGQDGDGYEYIYKCFRETDKSSEFTALTNAYSSNPSSNYQTMDEYYSQLSGWYDDPQSPTLGYPCWVSVRKKTGGVWGYYSEPAQWSMYITADGGTPGPAGENANFDYLIPNKEDLMAMIKTSISESQPVDLKCELDYSLCHVDGSNVTVPTWGSSSYSSFKIQLKAYNNSFNQIWSTYMTSNGSSTGTAQGSYSKTNLLAEINPSSSYSSADYRDYMKCYSLHSNRCPIYLEVILFNGSTVVDKRVVNVLLESGAVMKVMDDKIVSAVSDSEADTKGWVQNNYSTTEQTASQITSTVTSQMNNYVTSEQFNSTITQTSTSILTTVSREYATKDEISDIGAWEEELVDLRGWSENSFYPCSISLERNRTFYQRIIVSRYFDQSKFGNGPSWGTYNKYGNSNAFALNLDWNTIGSGWGSTWDPSLATGTISKYPRFINNYECHETRDVNNIPANYIAGNIRQCPFDSKNGGADAWADEIVYLRGGSQYLVKTDWESSRINVWQSGYSNNGFSANVLTRIYTGNNDTWDETQYFRPNNIDAITYSQIEQTASTISARVVETVAPTKSQFNSLTGEVNGLYDDVNGLEGEVNGLNSDVENIVAITGIDITNRKIHLRADKVTFENSTGTVDNKVWIDNNTGTLHAVDGEFSGNLNASVMYTSVFEISKNNATASGGELQYYLVNNNYPLYNSYVVWRHDTDTNEKEVVVILPSASTYKGIEFEFFAPFVARPMGTKNVWIRSSSDIRYLRSSSTSNYNEDRGYLDWTSQLIMPYNKLVKIKSMKMNGLWTWVVSSGDKWKTSESCLNPMYNLP